MFIAKKEILKCLINENSNIKDVISAIEAGGLRIALIINSDNKFIGTICDGDIRRGLLKGFTLESPITKIINKNSIKASPDSSKKSISRMMEENGISQIPILSFENELVGLEISDDLLPKSSQLINPNYALLMAGGRGVRLKPITNDLPKPLIPINGKPILEIILEQCIDSGIRNFYISVHYLAEKIINYFGDGSKWNVNINYIREDKPLGTAGALNLLPEEFKDPIILINGDVLTKTKFQEVLKYHYINSADLTICAREYVLESPYGVIEVDGIKFNSIIEKPTFRQLVNAGIYVINPSVIKLVKTNSFLDMPELLSICKKDKGKIIVYPVHEYWLDIGKPEALEKANYDWQKNILI